MITLIDKLQDLVKSYNVFKTFDQALAANYRKQIDDLRLAIALDADIRQIYFDELIVPANASAYKRDIFFTRGDTRFIVNRGMASLAITDTVSLLHQGKRKNVITRQDVAWQQLFPDIQLNGGTIVGQQTMFEFPEEIYFEKNETLDLGVTSSAAGWIWLHGCNLKDDYTPDVDNIKAEIAQSLPEWQIIPLVFHFTSNTLGNKAVGADGLNNIYSLKSDKSVVLTHVSISTQQCRISLFDDGRSQEICNEVEATGIAAAQTNAYTSYYPLPYPHLLRKQDRLKVRALNGSNLPANSPVAANTPVYLTFAGYTI